jgi:hypothetical protein
MRLWLQFSEIPVKVLHDVDMGRLPGRRTTSGADGVLATQYVAIFGSTRLPGVSACFHDSRVKADSELAAATP